MSGSPSWMVKLEEIAQKVVSEQGCLLYDLEFVGVGKGRTLRLFIDKEVEGAISIDDCSNVSRALNEILDADESLVPGEAYTMEVSTPGLERSLTKPWHFSKAVGKKIYLKTTKSLETLGVDDKKWKAAKTVEDVLQSADDEGIRFVIKDVEIRIPYDAIDRAKLVFEMTKGQKK